MKLSKEMLEKAKAAGTAEELAEMAKADGIEMTADESARVFANLNKQGELSDEELDNVSGGCGGGSGNPTPAGGQNSPEMVTFRYIVGQEIEVFNNYSLSTRTTRHKILECKAEEYWSDEYNCHRYAPRYYCARVDDPKQKKWVYQYDIEDPG